MRYFGLCCTLIFLFSCQKPIKDNKKWRFETHLDSKYFTPRTVVYYNEQLLDTFSGVYDTISLRRTPFNRPDSALAVCKGHFQGAWHWLCANKNKDSVAILQCYEDSESYNEAEETYEYRFYKTRYWVRY